MERINLYSIFHMNLHYSSIPEDRRYQVIEECYFPLFNLANYFPIAIEAPAWTLEEMNKIAQYSLTPLKELIEAGRIEFIGSGYSQIIGPIVPYKVNKANLDIGIEVYKELLGITPKIWYVNEQAYSPGLIENYVKHGAEAIVMEWNNPSTLHPEWPDDAGNRPQTALGTGKYSVPVIWNDSIMFQKFQRYAHDDDTTFFDFFRHLVKVDGKGKWTCLYGSDAEVFNFRPGRFHTEKKQNGDEWGKIRTLYEKLQSSTWAKLVFPSDALKNKGHYALRLESPASPIVVKKQPKYNVTRWAVTGRDNLYANAGCFKALENDVDKKELCYLWSSDFRSHITIEKWEAYKKLLKLKAWNINDNIPQQDEGSYWVMTDSVFLSLNKKKGFSIRNLLFNKTPAICTLKHGYYDEIDLGADFYSGNVILQEPARTQVTDLNPVTMPFVSFEDAEMIGVSAICTTTPDVGPVIKTYVVWKSIPQIEVRVSLPWAKIPKGSLNLGILTFNPEAFDKDALYYGAHNGGKRLEKFRLKGSKINHSQPVSNTVSATGGLGATEGVVVVGDKKRAIDIWFDQKVCPAMPMLRYEETRKSFLLRLLFSCAEYDESRPNFVEGPINFVMRIRG